MSRSVFARLRLLGPVTAAAALGLGTLPALAQTTAAPMATDCSAMHFELANPNPGSMIEPGGMVLQGIAMDSRAQGNTGIDHIDFFLDNRDQGGVNLGIAMPGMAPGPFGPDSFETTVTIPNLIGGHDLFAYAYSSVTGAQSVISVPVVVGEDPSKVGELGTTATDSCMPGGASSTTTPVTPMTPPATTSPTTPATTPATATTTPATTTTTTTTTAVAPSATTITVEVSNPSAGDTIHVGGYTIEGTAFDKAAQSGSGIDRVDIFLDSRDSGGMFLTEAMPGTNNMWHAIVPLPTNQTGLHTLSFYAHSSVTGQESVVSIPVTIAP
jgi:hypothetical protein